MDKPEATLHMFAEPGASQPLAIDKEITPYTVQRKPLPPPSEAHQQPTIYQKEIAPEPRTLHHTQSLPTYQQSHGPRRPQTLLSRLQSRWQFLSWRVRAAIIAGVTCLLILIIGLAAGLARRSRITNLPLPSNHGGPYSGDLTYYDPALGACGLVNSGSDAICAVSHIIFDAVSVGSNPNANPLCGKKIRARRDGKSIDLTVVDRCVGCKATDIDTTRSVFGQLAEIDQGRVPVSWSWLEDVPDAAATG